MPWLGEHDARWHEAGHVALPETPPTLKWSSLCAYSAALNSRYVLIPFNGLAKHCVCDPDRMAVGRNTAPTLGRVARGHCGLFLGFPIYYYTMSRKIELCKRLLEWETARPVKRLKGW